MVVHVHEEDDAFVGVFDRHPFVERGNQDIVDLTDVIKNCVPHCLKVSPRCPVMFNHFGNIVIPSATLIMHAACKHYSVAVL